MLSAQQNVITKYLVAQFLKINFTQNKLAHDLVNLTFLIFN